MTQALAKEYPLYPPEEYLKVEEQAQEKSEYHNGEVVSMAKATPNHIRITKNVTFAIDEKIEGKACESFFADLKVWIEQRNFYTYPDVMVICGQPQFFKGRHDTIVNPSIIIEVLSASTESYDRKDKFHAYWTLDSLKEYVLIDQYQVRVEYFRRVDAQTWELRIFTKTEDVLSLQSIEAEIPLSKIYRKVEFGS